MPGGMKTLSTFLASVLFVSVAACGGPDKPAEAPESTGAVTEPTSGGTDMPPAATEPETTAAPAAPTLALPAAPVKITLDPTGKDKKKTVLELGPDGTLMAEGKEIAKFSGGELSMKGKSAMNLMADNSVITPEGTSVGSFNGDEFTATSGAKFSVADDGTVTMTGADGKEKTAAKAEGVGAAKRATLLVLAAWMTTASSSSTSPVAAPKK